MNHMAEVAKIFDKGLNEPFTAKWKSGRYQTETNRICKFSERGLEVQGKQDFYVYDEALKKLLTGRAVIAEDEK